MNSPRSLVLITVDCLRADHVGFLGYSRPTTPFLDSLAGESLVFPTAIVAGAPTYFSFPVILAGRYPLALGRDIVGLSPSEPTLASVLEESGYATGAFNAGNPYLSRRFGYDTGFRFFDDFLGFEQAVPQADEVCDSTRLRSRLNHKLNQFCHKFGPLGNAYDKVYFHYCQRIASSSVNTVDGLRSFPSAEAIVDRAEEWLSNVSKPFFLWLHLMDCHSPYYPTAKALEHTGEGRITPTRVRYLNSYWNRSDLGTEQLRTHRDEMVALYDASIRCVDDQLERLAGALRRSGQLDNCVFAVTSDHGEQFLEHGGRYHAPSNVSEELVRVPLMIRAPGINPRPISDQPFSLLHLAPTLLGAVGAAVPGEFAGRNYWTEIQGGEGWNETVIVESVTGCTNPFRHEDRLGPRILALRDSRYKLVIDFGLRREQLFDLRTDPAELNPLPENTGRPVRRRMLEKAREHLLKAHSYDSEVRMSARLRELRHDWSLSRYRDTTDVIPAENQSLLGATGS